MYQPQTTIYIEPTTILTSDTKLTPAEAQARLDRAYAARHEYSDSVQAFLTQNADFTDLAGSLDLVGRANLGADKLLVIVLRDVYRCYVGQAARQACQAQDLERN